MKISKYLKEALSDKGALVIMTRDGDYDLGTPKATYRKKSDFDHRIKVINQSHADYYVSIHLNYLEDFSYYGAQVFYNDKLKENKDIAESVQKYLNEKLATNRSEKKLSNSIYMYSKLDIKGVLVECGFLSNKKEREKLLDDNYLKNLAMYLTEAFEKIINT